MLRFVTKLSNEQEYYDHLSTQAAVQAKETIEEL